MDNYLHIYLYSKQEEKPTNEGFTQPSTPPLIEAFKRIYKKNVGAII